MSRASAALIAVALVVSGSPPDAPGQKPPSPTLIAGAPRPTSITLVPSTTCGRNPTAHVNLSAPAPALGLVIQVTSSVPSAVSVPASVSARAGEAFARFQVTCVQINQSTAVTISATANGTTQSAMLSVVPLGLAGITVEPHTTSKVVSGRATLNGPAPSGGLLVTLTSAGPIVGFSSSTTFVGTVGNEVTGATGARLTVPAGSESAPFSVTVAAVQQPTPAQVLGTALGVTKSVDVTVMPPRPSVLFPSGNAPATSAWTVPGGTVQTARVDIDGMAPPGGLIVQLTSSNPGVAPVPAAMVIQPGAHEGDVSIATVPVAQATPVTIYGSVGGYAGKSSVLTVAPPKLNTFTVQTTAVVGGQTTVGTVSLNTVAPPGGMTIQLSSNNTAAATVPSTITIPQGQQQGTFTISTVAITQVSQTRLVTISASAGGGTRSVQVTVIPPSPSR